QAIELVGGVEAPEDCFPAPGGKRPGEVGRGAPRGGAPPHSLPPPPPLDPLRAVPQGDPEQPPEADANRRCQEAVIDRQFDEKGTAQRQRDTAQPHQPVLDQDLLPALSGRSRRRRCSDLGEKGGRRVDRFFGQWRLGYWHFNDARPQTRHPGQPPIENLDASLQGEDSRGQRASTEKRSCRQNRSSDDAQAEQPVHASPPEVPAGLADGSFAGSLYIK